LTGTPCTYAKLIGACARGKQISQVLVWGHAGSRLQKAMDEYQQACLKTFNSTRKGEAIQKSTFPKLREITVTEDLAKLQEMFDQAMHHAMTNQSSVLMNSVPNVVRETIASGMQMGYKGPCYSQPKSSATAGARAGNTVVSGTGTQPQQPNTARTGAG
jgi:hypothetical protein